MKNFCLLLCSLLLSACAPAATSTSAIPLSVTNALTPGNVYVLEGSDQNGQAFEGRLTLGKAAPESSGLSYSFKADQGVLVTDSEGIIKLASLNVGEKEVVCVMYRGENHLPYRGRAVRANIEEIEALLNRFQGSDNSLFGVSSCALSKA